MLFCKKILSIQYSEIFHSCAFSDEINVENFKKVVKNLIDRVRTLTPINLKSELEVYCFLNHHNITLSGSDGG
jgi:hypothetical protein